LPQQCLLNKQCNIQTGKSEEPHQLQPAEEYKKARFDLRRTIKLVKKDYRKRLEGYYTTADPRRMWQGLQHITEYGQMSPCAISGSIILSDELNEFYVQFKPLSHNTRTITHGCSYL